MPNDIFSSTADSLIAPARLAFELVPSDTDDLALATKAIYIGSGGDIVLRAIGSETDVTLRNVVSGSVLAIRAQAIRSNGTTASSLVGLA
jgi:hypothetical protein